MKPTDLASCRVHLSHLQSGKSECLSSYSSAEVIEFLLAELAKYEIVFSVTPPEGYQRCYVHGINYSKTRDRCPMCRDIIPMGAQHVVVGEAISDMSWQKLVAKHCKEGA